MKRKTQLNKPESLWALLPVMLVIALLPLVLRLKVMEVPTPYPWYDEAVTIIGDIFCYYKGAILIVCALTGSGMILYKVFLEKYKIEHHKLFYCAYVYMGMAGLSWIFTIDRHISTYGYIGHLENIFVLFGYVMIFLFTAMTVRSERGFKIIIGSWMISQVILFIIGLSQFIGHNIIYTDFYKSLIVPAQYLAQGDDVFNLKVPDGIIFQTLYHYNYVSFYASLAAPFFIGLFLFDPHRKRRIAYILLVAASLFNLFGSTARNGFIGVAAALLLLLFFYRRHFIKQWKIVVGSIAGLAIAVAIFNSATDQLLLNRFKQLASEITTTQNYPLNAINTGENLQINHDSYTLTIQKTDDEDFPYAFYNEAGELLHSKLIDKVYQLADSDSNLLPAYSNLQYEIGLYEEEPALVLSIDGSTWPFCYTDNQFFFINTIGKLEPLQTADAFGFEGKERMGSARGYIWSRTLPLLKKYFFFGSGPDTYAIVFPQNDYVGKFNAYDTSKIVVDKPHNILLDYAVNTGVPSLIALLFLWIGYIFWSFKLYFRSEFKSYASIIGIASLSSVVGYLVSGMFNDTNVNVTPVFWIILGLGFAANMIYQKEISRP